eukprot:Skav211588  [mRNA]  locus=scaffold2962:17002:19062:- [translate_table: standard]
MSGHDGGILGDLTPERLIPHQVLLASDPTASTSAAALTAREAEKGRDMKGLGGRNWQRGNSGAGIWAQLRRPISAASGRRDPLERLGLAHFHEHMLFLGTEKYPKEDEYSWHLRDDIAAAKTTQRSGEAVDSESTNYSTEDGWRLLQVLKASRHRYDVATQGLVIGVVISKLVKLDP